MDQIISTAIRTFIIGTVCIVLLLRCAVSTAVAIKEIQAEAADFAIAHVAAEFANFDVDQRRVDNVKIYYETHDTVNRAFQAGGGQGVATAFYDPDRNIIMIDEEVKMNTPEGISTMIHEMVHVFQYASNQHEFVMCLNELEDKAYKIQTAYLADTGYDTNSKFYKDLRMLGIVTSACNPHRM